MNLASVRPLAAPLMLEERVAHNETYWTLKPAPDEDVLTLYQALKDRGAFLVKLFGQDARKTEHLFYVHLVFSLAPNDAFLTLKLAVSPDQARFPSITPVFHGANWMEREVQDLFGLRAQGHPNPRRWVSHGNWPKGVYPLRKDVALQAEIPWGEGDFELRQVEGEGVFEIPVGPVHAGVIEPGHFRFSVAGEPIINLQARLFYTHKGTEKRAEGQAPSQVLHLAERISGDAGFAHATAFCHAIEWASGVDAPPRAKALRVVLLELERIYNHIADVGALANDVAFAVGYARAMAVRERVLNLNERWTGSRLLRGTAALGGVRVDLGDSQANDIQKTLHVVEREFSDLWALLQNSASVMDRFEGTGVLSPDSARDLGILGLAGRASGIRRDARCDHPHAAYDGCAFEVPLQQAGDVLARARIRVAEVAQSASIVRQTLARLPGGPVQVALPPLPPHAQALGYVESWRGEAYHWVCTDAKGRLTRYKVTDPSSHNWPAMLFAVQDNIVADFPVINKSFNLSYSGNDR